VLPHPPSRNTIRPPHTHDGARSGWRRDPHRARVLKPRLNEALGPSLVVDNRAGAGGMIGTDIVAKAAPDGYTLKTAFDSFVSTPLTPALRNRRQHADGIRHVVEIGKRQMGQGHPRAQHHRGIRFALAARGA